MDMSREPAIGWQLPPFYCPLERAIHPRVAELERRALAWMDQLGLCEDEVERAWSIAAHSADFSGRIIPHGRDEPLLLFIEWNQWAFAFDDVHDAAAQAARSCDAIDVCARVARSLEAPGAALLGRGPFARAFADLAARTRAATDAAQFGRFCAALRDYLFGVTWQVAQRERATLPPLSEYAAMRPSMNGTRFSLAWSAIAGDIAVPERELMSAPVQALIDAAGFIVSCDNDLFSYAKDDDGETPEPNLVNVLAHLRGSTPRQALPEAVAIRDRCMTLFLRLRQQLARTAGRDLGRYLDSLGYYISGCIEWQSRAPRYASPRNRNTLPVPGAAFDITFTDRPSDATTEPVPIPSIAWWWQQLAV